MLSIVVACHNMIREAERTLYSLSTNYQQNVSCDEYEVLVVDNGSTEPLSDSSVKRMGRNFHYHFLDTDSVSPVAAINWAVATSRGDDVAVIIDGARLTSPGLVRTSLNALKGFEDAFICALAWHIGPDVQNASMRTGYDQQAEDQLLDSIAWQANGYRLFDISTLAQSSECRLLGGTPNECSWCCMPRNLWESIGGFDERFQSAGGGLASHDVCNRAYLHQPTQAVVLLGEGTFHQFHGGVATNVPLSEHPISLFREEYLKIRGEPLTISHRPDPYYIGKMPSGAYQFLSTKFAVA